MWYIPRNVTEMYGHLSLMAADAPRYEQIFNPDGDPIGAFSTAREGLANIKYQMSEKAYLYLLARIEENWERLQSSNDEDLRQLKLSFGEMAHFLRVKKYKAANIMDDLVEHTEIQRPV